MCSINIRQWVLRDKQLEPQTEWESRAGLFDPPRCLDQRTLVDIVYKKLPESILTIPLLIRGYSGTWKLYIDVQSVEISVSGSPSFHIYRLQWTQIKIVLISACEETRVAVKGRRG